MNRLLRAGPLLDQMQFVGSLPYPEFLVLLAETPTPYGDGTASLGRSPLSNDWLADSNLVRPAPEALNAYLAASIRLKGPGQPRRIGSAVIRRCHSKAVATMRRSAGSPCISGGSPAQPSIVPSTGISVSPSLK